MGFFYKYICELLLVLLLSFFFLTKDMNNCYDKAIMAEGLGYYAYLPATYIYHDYSFSFFNKIYSKYYCPGFEPPTRNFTNEFDGIKLNKYYPGVSLLWLPFFLLAHLLALLSNLPADGYSNIYQYAISMAGIFYAWLGLRFTRKILLHYNIPAVIQAVTLTTILFGTNMLLYAAAWSAQTHVYSFFLIAAFCWFLIRLFHPEDNQKPACRCPASVPAGRDYALCMSFIFLALIVTARPQNGAILVLLPFFGLRKSKFLEIVRKHLFSFLSLVGLFIAFLLVARVCYYWYLQTGRIFLNPYKGEHYFLDKPHLLESLFSYRKGWILYSPFVAVGLAGIFFFKRQLEKVSLFIFWGLFIYVSSCWWCWTYSPTSFGQRIYIDFYSLIALQAAILFSPPAPQRGEHRTPLWGAGGLTSLIVIPLCILQTLQYKKGIIDGDAYTKEDYWRNFFAVKPVAYYPIPPETITDKQEININFDGDFDRLNHHPGTELVEVNDSRTKTVSYSGSASTFICKSRPFSETKKIPLPVFMIADGYSNIRVTAMVKTDHCKDETQCAYVTKDQSLVIDINRNGKSISYNGYGLSNYVHSNRWTRFQKGFIIPPEVQAGDTATIYFWKATADGEDTTFIDNLKVEFIHTDKSYMFIR